MALKTVDYDGRQHTVYAAGRAMPEDTKANWMRAFAEQLPARRPLSLIDLGSGIGRLTPALAETFGGPVHGVEPSAKMREVAEAAGPHAGVEYLEGEAARIPLDDASADAVLMFLSFHHVPDRAAAAKEIARVLKPGGKVMIVSAFSKGTAGGSWWLQFFPRAGEIERAMFPALEATLAQFAAAGLTHHELVQVPLRFWDSAAQAAGQLRLRPYSTFEHLTEAEIEEGFRRLDALAAAQTSPQPIIGKSDLLVLS